MVNFIADTGNELLLTKIRAIILSVGCDTNKLSQNYKEKSFPYIKFLAGRCNETVFSAHTSLTILSILFLLPLFKDFMKMRK